MNFFFILWCFTGVKHLGTCDFSGLWLLAEPSGLNFGRPGLNSWIFFSQNPTPLVKAHVTICENDYESASFLFKMTSGSCT